MIEPLKLILNDAFKNAGFDIETITIIKSNRPDLCDYQCDDVFKLAKKEHKNPIEIGNQIVAALKENPKFSDYFAQADFVAPGFINFTLANSFINETLTKMYQDEYFNLKKPTKIETYMLDFGGPNVAKPLHVGHLRSAVVGESIQRIIKFRGHKTISDVHLGDYGLQIGQVIYGIMNDNKSENEITLEYLEEIYPKVSGLCKDNEEIKKKCAEITKDLQDGNEYYQHLWKIILDISSNDIKRIYKYLDINFDLWKGESDAYPYIETLKKDLAQQHLLEKSEGALIIPVAETTDTKELPPFIFEKSNGAYLYSTTDLATILQRKEDFDPDHYIYVADLRQTIHLEQVFRASKKAGITNNATLEFCGFGTVNGTDGKPFKTRKGDAPKLDSLFEQVKEIFISKKESNITMNSEDIDKIVNAILKFADLQNNRERNYIFDIAKFSEVIGKTGPYVLYTYVRINKLLNEINKKEFNKQIYNNNDRELRMKLLELDRIIDKAFTEKMPNYIAEYIYDLCVSANNFYQNNRLIDLEDTDKKTEWILLLTLSNRLLKQLLHLLAIDIPSVM